MTTRQRREQERQLAAKRLKRQTAAVVIFAAAILFFIVTVFPSVSPGFNSVLAGLFGSVVYSLLWCALIFYISILLALDDPERGIGGRIATALTAVLVVCALFSTIIDGGSYVSYTFAQTKQMVEALFYAGRAQMGAGVAGGFLGALMVIAVGRPLAIVLEVLAAFVMLMLLTKTGLMQLFETIARPVRSASDRMSVAAERSRERAEERRTQYEEERRRRRTEPEAMPMPRKRGMVMYDIDDDEIQPEEEPVKQEPVKKRRKPSARPAEESTMADTIDKATDDVLRALAEKPADEPAQPQNPDIDELTERIASKKTRRQRAQEVAEQAISFQSEVEQAKEQSEGEYKFPPAALLTAPEEADDSGIRGELRHNAEQLVNTLEEYNVSASVIDISRGPAVTRYELKPAPGVKISKITALTNDIALRLAAKAVRIEAPIPGKPAVGVEIPNQKVTIVRVRELIDSEQFREAKSPVTVCIGKDIEGKIVLADLSKMPHLLVAGSTGSGKSVCINSMLMSLIYKSSPEDLRLILIDPKAVEMDVYNGIPHLLVPVVCDPKKAAGALQWAVSEMLKRYALLKEHGVRNIDGYNRLAANNPEMKKMPRIVIIIDEMADLMASTPKEVEDAIARLAAMARAAGMHMVLATQRPSVDVITGTIKNNIPSRIAFAVSSQIDSRTILDEGGAEGLIGYGDMLFNPIGAQKPRRVQGCLVEDEEVEAVVSFVKQNGEADYDESIAREIERNAAETGGQRADSGDDDPGLGEVDILFNKAIEVVIEAGQASTAMLQRRLGVGYARAGRLIDQLEERGVIGPFEGSKPRQVLMSRQQFLEMTMAQDVSDEPTQLEPPSDDDDDAPF